MNTSATSVKSSQGSLDFDGILGGEEYSLLKKAMPHYDDLQAAIGEALVHHFGREPITMPLRVLEIGPGNGITTKVILDCGLSTTIVAVDNGTKMRAALEGNLAKWGAAERVEIVPMDIYDYLKTQPACSFDAVVSGFVLHNIEHVRRSEIVREIFRVTKHGGVYVGGDKMVPDNLDEYCAAYVEQMARFQVFTDEDNLPELTEEWRNHYMRDAQPHIVYTEQAAMDDLKAAGFNAQSAYRHMLELVFAAWKV